MASLSYLEKVINRLKAQRVGIVSNIASWTGQPDTPVTHQANIDALELVDADIKVLENQLTQKRQAAKLLAEQKSTVADATELRIKGIHAAAPAKWVDYGLTDPTSDAAMARTTRQVPAKGIIKSISDDYDGIGFIIDGQSLTDADTYEFERGIATTATDVNTIPPMSHYKTSRKVKLTDDEVEKGKRYFYRYRGLNSKGTGEWSEPVSRVQ
jgi:hypothetical protein